MTNIEMVSVDESLFESQNIRPVTTVWIKKTHVKFLFISSRFGYSVVTYIEDELIYKSILHQSFEGLENVNDQIV
jgi:hypothetical protein